MYVKKVSICTTIPQDIWTECKNKGLPLNHVFIRGWQVINGEPQILGRQRELEEQVKKLQEANKRMQNTIYELAKGGEL